MVARGPLTARTMSATVISRADPTDLYEQVAGEIRRAIADGEATPNRERRARRALLSKPWWDGGTTYRRAVFKTTDGGKTKSLDGGARWRTANRGLSLTSVSALAVDPQHPRTVYSSTGSLGLFKSRDMGGHWRPLTSAPHLADGIALDPSNPRNLAVVAAGYGVVRSIDGGRTWTEAHLDADSRGVTVVAISGTTAYAGANGDGLFGSTDGGRSWPQLGPAGAVHLHALAISPADPAVVYAGVYGSQAGGLYRSTDGGSSWRRLTLRRDRTRGRPALADNGIRRSERPGERLPPAKDLAAVLVGTLST